MKRFTFRLFLVRKLIESLTWSCIDEYTELEDVADGLAKAHSAMDRTRKPDTELIDACKMIVANGSCSGIKVQCSGKPKDGWVRCPNYGKMPSKSWRCTDAEIYARRWLAEHGIKE